MLIDMIRRSAIKLSEQFGVQTQKVGSQSYRDPNKSVSKQFLICDKKKISK